MHLGPARPAGFRFSSADHFPVISLQLAIHENLRVFAAYLSRVGRLMIKLVDIDYLFKPVGV
jgi:hypothetical protein